MTDYRLVALDIDGTVLDSSGRVTHELRRCLLDLEERGVHVVLCTGRRWRNTVEVAREIGCEQSVIICCGGGLVKRADDERTLYADAMPLELSRRVVDLYREGGLVPFLLYDRALSGVEMMLGETDRGRAEGLNYVQANPGCFEWYDGAYPDVDEEPVVIFTMDHAARVRDAKKDIREGIGEDGIVEAMFQHRYGPDQLALEVHRAGSTKWRALKWLLDSWDIPASRVVAIGDDVNDIAMLEAVGLSFAMGNAIPQVKEAAHAVTTSNDEHGVVRALEGVFGLSDD